MRWTLNAGDSKAASTLKKRECRRADLRLTHLAV